MNNDKAQWTQLLAIGTEFVVLVVGATAAGAYIDEYLATNQPYATLLGALLGLAASVVRLVRTTRSDSTEDL